MPRRCPHCSVMSRFSERGDKPFFRHLPTGDTCIGLETCDNCGRTIAIVVDGANRELEMFPNLEIEPDEELPEDVKTAFRQAMKSLNEGIWDGCVVMCRRALEEATNNLNAEGKDLYNKIEYLADQNRITPQLKDWAHEGRLEGNLGAHGGKGKKWAERADAEEIVEFCKWFFRYVYVLPRQLMERRARLATEAEDDCSSAPVVRRFIPG